jgi:hypothetical protein
MTIMHTWLPNWAVLHDPSEAEPAFACRTNDVAAARAPTKFLLLADEFLFFLPYNSALMYNDEKPWLDSICKIYQFADRLIDTVSICRESIPMVACYYSTNANASH